LNVISFSFLGIFQRFGASTRDKQLEGSIFIVYLSIDNKKKIERVKQSNKSVFLAFQ